MKIALSGSQSCGKTTVLNMLKKEWPNFVFKDEITREIAAMGFPINEGSTNMTQTLIINEHIRRSLIKEDVILDRCILDGMVYTKYFASKDIINKWVACYAKNACKMIIDSYDVIFYFTPKIEPVEDGVRSTCKEFREGIEKIFIRDIKKLNKSNIITLDQDLLEDRCKIISNKISELLDRRSK